MALYLRQGHSLGETVHTGGFGEGIMRAKGQWWVVDGKGEVVKVFKSKASAIKYIKRELDKDKEARGVKT